MASIRPIARSIVRRIAIIGIALLWLYGVIWSARLIENRKGLGSSPFIFCPITGEGGWVGLV